MLLTVPSPAGGSVDDATIVVQRLDTGERQELVREGTQAVFSPTGHLVFGRGASLWAVPFELETLARSRRPAPRRRARVPRHGARRPLRARRGRHARLLERDGRRASADVGRPPWADGAHRSAPAHVPRPARVARRLAHRRPGGGRRQRRLDLRPAARLAQPPQLRPRRGRDARLVSGRGLARVGDPALRPAAPGDASSRRRQRRRAGGLEHGPARPPPRLVPDGTELLATQEGESTSRDIWLVPVAGGEARPLLHGPFEECNPRFSPDGRWLAYSSDESGRFEVYVLKLPELDGKAQVSVGGGDRPLWSSGGREIVYRGADGQVASVRFSPAASGPPRVGRPVPLFPDTYGAAIGRTSHVDYDIHPDGSRFVMVGSQAGGASARPDRSPRLVRGAEAARALALSEAQRDSDYFVMVRFRAMFPFVVRSIVWTSFRGPTVVPSQSS